MGHKKITIILSEEDFSTLKQYTDELNYDQNSNREFKFTVDNVAGGIIISRLEDIRIQKQKSVNKKPTA